MEAPKEIYITIDPIWSSMAVNYDKNDKDNIKYIRSDLAELTVEDIKFIIDKYSELPIQYIPRLFEEILKQFNEQRQKK